MLTASVAYDLSACVQKYRRRIEMTRPPSIVGVFSQMMAALPHDVSPERLRRISALISKVLILTGDTDMLVDLSGSLFLKALCSTVSKTQDMRSPGGGQYGSIPYWRVIKEGSEIAEKSCDTVQSPRKDTGRLNSMTT